MGQGGFGVELKISINSNMTVIVGVQEPAFPEFEKFLAENTGHDADEGYATFVDSGKRKLNPFPLKIGWDKNETTHAALVTAFGSTDPVDMSVSDPDGKETIAFSAFVQKIGRVTESAGQYFANITIQPTGKATIS
jgi:hypothetical protein